MKALNKTAKCSKNEDGKKENNNRNNIYHNKINISKPKKPSTKLANKEEEFLSSIEATTEIAKMVEDLSKIESLKKQLLLNENKLKSDIMNYMEIHSYLTFEERLIVSWKASIRNSFDLTSFKKEYPDMYELYLEEIRVRVFRVV